MQDVHNSAEDVQLYGPGLDSPAGADVGNTRNIYKGEYVRTRASDVKLFRTVIKGIF